MQKQAIFFLDRRKIRYKDLEVVCVEIPVVEIIPARRRISDVVSKVQETNNMVSFGALKCLFCVRRRYVPSAESDVTSILIICKQWNIGKSRVNAEK